MKAFAIFLTVVLGIWTLMHAYVFWRAASIPVLAQHVPKWAWIVAALGGWLSYPLARIFCARGWDAIGIPLEWLGAAWMGTLFLLLAFVLAADVVTLGGLLFGNMAASVRLVALVIALVLAVIALVNGQRQPVVREHEVAMRGLPKERDGLVVVAASDLHLGTLLNRAWLRQLVTQVNGLKPDVLVLVGDIIDGDAKRVEPLVDDLAQLRAPLGVWAVTGNHDYYAGVVESVRVFQKSGFRVLRDTSAEVVPGLVMAGVDDLTARRDSSGMPDAVQTTLAQRPKGAVILLSHTPWNAEAAAKGGAGLMLSGHTHHGQVWPFNYLVRLRYALVGGRYEVNGMTAIVSRGAGTWGPRMRLWYPSEIVRIRLRAE